MGPGRAFRLWSKVEHAARPRHEQAEEPSEENVAARGAAQQAQRPSRDGGVKEKRMARVARYEEAKKEQLARFAREAQRGEEELVAAETALVEPLLV